MKKLFTALLLMLAMSAQAQQKQISYVKADGAWYQVYDAKQSVGEVIGVSGNTFNCRDGSWIKIYDKNGKKISTHSAN